MEPILYSSKFYTQMIGEQFSLQMNLDLKKAVRTYKVTNKQIKTVRAWHGHKLEEKWIIVEEGEFLSLCC
jgi:tRNA U34 5-carboxymethylaminomethyl modifying enzyme MnmG/GidA